MFVKQLYTSCLSEAAYYIESEGQAAIIDPIRDIDAYIQLATEHKATIKYIFETHFHADFVSGHIDLSNATSAPIVYGPLTETNYPVTVAKDGEVFSLGKTTITTLHTPGHTLESTCWLLKDESGKNHAVFTGDTLFIGDVGRPDLSSGNLTSNELAAMLYDSLQQKIIPLEDDVILYPAHGPGSSCGKNIGPETISTIGTQKQTNYALQPQTKENFVNAVTNGLNEAPVYFAINAQINKNGYAAIDDVLAQGVKNISLELFKANAFTENSIILDTRHATEFTQGFIPGSISIGLEGRFAEWAGMLLPFDKDIYLVVADGKEEETVVRLARVGFERIKGSLQGGYNTWINAGEKIDLIIDVEADELAMDIPFDDNLVVMDVRNETEYSNGHVKNAVNLPLSEMADITKLAMISDEANIYMHCAGGYRSVIASSLLKRQGYNNLRNVLGGWAKIKEQEKIKTELPKKAAAVTA
jgi:hydroxyacylglutathione hydrolase